MAEVLDLGSGDVPVRDIENVCLTLGADGNMYAVLEVRGGIDLMVYSDPDPDQVMRVVCAIEGAIEHAPRRVILADLVRAAKRGVDVMPRQAEFCSAREAAWRLDLPIEDVRALVRAGVLRGGRPGGVGLYRIQISSIDEFHRRGRSD